MLVWFDKNGILKEQLDSYGNPARVDSQYFKILAYFDGIDLSTYGAAFVHLRRPDIKGSSYPVLFMYKSLDFVYQNGISDTPSSYFVNGQRYPCFVFDFSTIRDLDYGDIVTLLDTPGIWEATITLISASSKVKNVAGTINFEVGGYDGPEEETELSFSIIAQNFASALAEKLDSCDLNYFRICRNFEEKARNGELAKAIYKPGARVFDEVNLYLYTINTVAQNENEGYEEYVYCTSFEKQVIFDPEGVYLTAETVEEFPEELPGHDKVIVQGSDIVYPYTKQENVIGLQQTIREKLPIVSETTPQSGFVPQQVWIDIGGERETVTLQFGRTGGPLNFGPQAASSELSFGRTPGQETELTFGNSNVNNNEN